MRKLLCYLEVFVSTILFSFFFVGDFNEYNEIVFNGFLNYIPIILLVILTLIYSIHYIFYDGLIVLFKVIFIYLALFMTSLMFFNDINTMNAFCLFFGLFSFIISFVSIFVEKNKEIKLKVGYYSIKQFYLMKTCVLSLVLIIFGFMVSTTNILSLWLQLLIVFIFYIICLVLYLYYFSKFDPLRKLINEFSSSLNFKNFNEGCLSLLSNDYIHEDSKTYINLLRTNYLFLKNKEDAINLFNSINYPKLKKYQSFYDSIYILTLINKEEKDLIPSYLLNMKNNYKNNKIISVIENIYNIYCSDILINNVEDTFNNVKSLLEKLISANDLVYYYKSRNNLIKAKEYASFIIKYNSDLDLLIKNAKEVLDFE